MIEYKTIKDITLKTTYYKKIRLIHIKEGTILNNTILKYDYHMMDAKEQLEKCLKEGSIQPIELNKKSIRKKTYGKNAENVTEFRYGLHTRTELIEG